MTDPDAFWKHAYGDNWQAEKAAHARFLREYEPTLLDRSHDRDDEEWSKEGKWHTK